MSLVTTPMILRRNEWVFTTAVGATDGRGAASATGAAAAFAALGAAFSAGLDVAGFAAAGAAFLVAAMIRNLPSSASA